MNGWWRVIMEVCARLCITNNEYLSSGMAAPSWWRGISVVVNRVIVCSEALNCSVKEVEGDSPGDNMSQTPHLSKGLLTRIPAGRQPVSPFEDLGSLGPECNRGEAANPVRNLMLTHEECWRRWIDVEVTLK